MDWKEAQTKVAQFLEEYGFAIKQEVSLKSGRRLDILGIKKIASEFLHVLIEVKDWNTVSRKNEMEFSKQIIQYLIDYSLQEFSKKSTTDRWNRLEGKLRDKFLGILCLTKDCHFSFREISTHFIEKNPNIKGIPFREQIAEQIQLYAARFDFLPQAFEKAGYRLFKQKDLTNWFQ